MDRRSKNLIKNVSILTLSNFSSKIIVFLLVPLYTSVLTTFEYGAYDVLMATIQLFVPLLTLNIADGVLRFIMDKNEAPEAVKCIGTRYTLVANFGWAIIILANHFFGVWDLLKQYDSYVFLYFFFYSFNQLFLQTAKGQERIKELAIAGMLSTCVSLFCNVLFLIIIPMGLYGFFRAYVLGQASSAIYLFIKIKFPKGLSLCTDARLKGEMLTYSVPLILNVFGWLINNVSDRYVVSGLCGISENGIYSVSYKIPTIITTIQSIFIQAWTISAIKEYESDSKNVFYQRTFAYMNVLIVEVCTILILFTKVIAKLLYAKDFYNAWKYVPFLLISVVFGASSGFIGPILSAQKKTRIMAMSTIYGAVVNLVLNFVLIYYIGTQGAAIATAISNLMIYIIRRRAVGKLLYGGAYRRIIITWFLLILQAVMMIADVNPLVQTPIIFIETYLYKEEIRTIIDNLWKVKRK